MSCGQIHLLGGALETRMVWQSVQLIAQVRGCNKRSGPDRHYTFFANKLCAVATLIESFQQQDDGKPAVLQEMALRKVPTWIMVLDGDMMPSNMPLTDLQKDCQGRSMIFYERFMNGEIMAGGYALKVSTQAAGFMRKWETLTAKSNFGFSNYDNGALHLHMVSYLSEELSFPQGQFKDAAALTKHLEASWHQSVNLATYDGYVAAAKLALGPKRAFRDVLILRRGQGMCNDKDMLPLWQSERFFCLHGFKNRKSIEKVIGEAKTMAVEKCESSFPAAFTAQVPDLDTMKKAVAAFKPSRLGLGRQNDVANCWPDCPSDIPEQQWETYKEGLEKNANCDVALLRRSANYHRCGCDPQDC